MSRWRAFLRSYQLHGGYTPGPLLALSALAGLAGSAVLVAGPLARRRRRRRPGTRTDMRPGGTGMAAACFLFFTVALAVLLTADLFEFSWRYQLPALVTLPPAGALGLTLLTRRPAAQVRAGKD